MGKKPARQHAALPYRVRDGVLEVLLVTSRETRRWVLPKGWPEKGLGGSALAAKEALEEAGLIGEVATSRVGTYEYDKRLGAKKVLRCSVDVFPLLVTGQATTWKEQGQREARWFTPGQAAMLVHEGGLVALLLAFGAPGRGREAA